MNVSVAAVPLLALVMSGAAQSVTAQTTLRMRGVIQKYDVAHRTLSVRTANGIFELQVTPTIPIRHGWQDIDAATLSTLRGYRVAVRYSDSDGSRTAASIHVFGKGDRTTP